VVFHGHAPQGFYPLLNKASGRALLLVFLYLSVAGGGAWSAERPGGLAPTQSGLRFAQLGLIFVASRS